jgi:transposase InsO family protein
MHGAEHNYHIHDKELLAVVRALQCWRSELIGLQSEEPFLIVSDHEALKYFSTKRLLNIRQAGWAEFLSQYNFHITYRPGSENAAADSLSRKTEDATTQRAKREAYRTMQLFAPVRADDRVVREGVAVAAIMALDEGIPAPPGSGFQLVDELLEANRTTPELEEWRQKAREGDDDFSLLGDRLLLHSGRLVVPAADNLRTRVIQEAHSRLVTAHPGRNKTRKLVAARYWWPRMNGDVEVFVDNCMPCRSSKYPRDKTPGLLQPIPPPQRGWQCLVVDFNELPPDKYGFDNALVMIDRLTKASWTVPCRKSATARDAARMYYEGPYRVYGLPQEIISDQGPQFKADFTDELSRILGIEWKLATPGHSQTAGQVENLNQYINQRLRPFVSHYQDNWSKAIPALDAVQASLPHDSTGLQPHEVLFGFPMPMPFDWESRTADLNSRSPRERLNRQEAQEAARRIQGYVEYARGMILKAQEKQVEQANRHRRAPDFDVGDHVVILKHSEITSRPSDKLSFPVTQQHYEILEKTADGAYRLKVPESWRGSTIFTADRLRRYPNNPLPGQAAENPPGEDIAGQEEWEVERILASRTHYGKLQYRAQWRGWDPDPIWYPASDFRNAPAALKRFHDEYPDRAGPPLRLDDWLLAAAEDRFADPHPDDDKPKVAGAPLRRSTRKKK